MNKLKVAVFLGIMAFNNQIVVASTIDELFAQARPNPTYGTQRQEINDEEQKGRKNLELNELVKTTNIQELFDTERTQAVRTQQERIRKEKADERELCSKMSYEEAKRRQAEEEKDFRARVTPYVMVEDKDRKGVYVRREFREFFGEDGTVYDRFPRNRQHFEVGFPNGETYDHDDGYSTWFLEYETPAETPFMKNEDGTFSYQLDYKGRKLLQTVSKVNCSYVVRYKAMFFA